MTHLTLLCAADKENLLLHAGKRTNHSLQASSPIWASEASCEGPRKLLSLPRPPLSRLPLAHLLFTIFPKWRACLQANQIKGSQTKLMSRYYGNQTSISMFPFNWHGQLQLTNQPLLKLWNQGYRKCMPSLSTHTDNIILPYKCILLIPDTWLELAEVRASGVKSMNCAGRKWYLLICIHVRQVIGIIQPVNQ